MSVIVCVLLAWTITAAFFLPKWQQSGKAKRVKRNSGREVGESGVLIDFTACRCQKKKPRKLKTLTHTHKHSQISLFWSRAVHGLSGFSRNRNRDKRKYSLLFPNYVEWEARATCFARPALVCCPGQIQVQSSGVSLRARVMRVTIGLEGEG